MSQRPAKYARRTKRQNQQGMKWLSRTKSMINAAVTLWEHKNGLRGAGTVRPANPYRNYVYGKRLAERRDASLEDAA